MKESERAVWELGEVDVFDGGADGQAATLGDNTLFARQGRAFSHGCVRVEKPFELAEEIMGTDGKWTEEKLRGLIGKGERTVNLATPLPVHLAYFTLAVDEEGELKRFEDIYGLDRKVRAALNLSE